MTVISSAELRNNIKKYLDTAKTETVIIQRGKTETFVFHKKENFPEFSSDIPEDLHRGITKEELMTGIEKGLREMFKRKQTQVEEAILQ